METLSKQINKIKEKIGHNFFYLFIFMIFIGIVRNLLEVMGNKSVITGYYLSVPSIYNTVSYVFLMIIAEGYLLNQFFKGSGIQLRNLIQKGIWFLFGLFILIPLINLIFNYYLFKWPFIFDIRFIHPDLYFHYGPFGIHVAFIIVLFIFPFWLRKFYNTSLKKAFFITWPFYIIHFIYTYQIAMSFNWGTLMKYNPFNTYSDSLIGGSAVGPMVNIYTASFVLIVLIIYPFFMQKYPNSKKEYFRVSIIYIIMWLHFISLFHISLPWRI